MKVQSSDYKVEASIDGYRLFLYPDVPPDVREGCVGEITNTSNRDVLIRLVIDDEYMKYRFRQAHAYFVFNMPFVSECRIYFTRASYDAFCDDKRLQVMIWHEVGHFHTVQFFKDKTIEELRDERKNMRLTPEEVVADLFSMYQTSKDDVLFTLKYLIRDANIRSAGNNNAPITIAELRNRRELIRNVDPGNALTMIERIIGTNRVEF